MKTIRLQNKRWFRLKHGQFIAFVSDEDFVRVSEHKWYASVRKGKNFRAYACAIIQGKIVYLHRFLTGQDKLHDHKDGNGLNNTRENIRVVTNSENQFNTHKHRNRTLIDRRRRWKTPPTAMANVFGGDLNAPNNG